MFYGCVHRRRHGTRHRPHRRRHALATPTASHGSTTETATAYHGNPPGMTWKPPRQHPRHVLATSLACHVVSCLGNTRRMPRYPFIMACHGMPPHPSKGSRQPTAFQGRGRCGPALHDKARHATACLSRHGGPRYATAAVRDKPSHSTERDGKTLVIPSRMTKPKSSPKAVEVTEGLFRSVYNSYTNANQSWTDILDLRRHYHHL